jgi:hypothetical protein
MVSAPEAGFKSMFCCRSCGNSPTTLWFKEMRGETYAVFCCLPSPNSPKAIATARMICVSFALSSKKMHDTIAVCGRGTL